MKLTLKLSSKIDNGFSQIKSQNQFSYTFLPLSHLVHSPRIDTRVPTQTTYLIISQTQKYKNKKKHTLYRYLTVRFWTRKALPITT